ncbi:hypothetical protein GD605_13305 [Desulfolutivibrio sulfoxidireducens]|nr:hypothetical protein GD605_13305 [Desulfolutivibrio sulfoxidireducens]
MPPARKQRAGRSWPDGGASDTGESAWGKPSPLAGKSTVPGPTIMPATSCAWRRKRLFNHYAHPIHRVATGLCTKDRTMIEGVSSNIQALSAIGVSQAVTANNVANVNTDGYQTARVTLETGQGGTGVSVQEVARDQTPGPMYFENRPEETEDGVSRSYTAVEASNVDLPVQMVRMLLDHNAYSANIAAIRTQDELVGSVLDMTA